MVQTVSEKQEFMDVNAEIGLSFMGERIQRTYKFHLELFLLRTINEQNTTRDGCSAVPHNTE